MTSSVAAMLAQLKNAALARKSFVEMTSSKFRERLGHLLVKESYLKGALPISVWIFPSTARVV